MTDVKIDALIGELAANTAALERNTAALQSGATARPAPSHRGGGQRATGGAGARFGNYGRNKGGLVEGAPMSDLEYYAGGCRRSLADPAKSRFHESERVLLAAIEAEIARQSGRVDTQAGDGFPDEPEPNF